VALDEYIDMYREWQAIKDGKSRKAQEDEVVMQARAAASTQHPASPPAALNESTDPHALPLPPISVSWARPWAMSKLVVNVGVGVGGSWSLRPGDSAHATCEPVSEQEAQG